MNLSICFIFAVLLCLTMAAVGSKTPVSILNEYLTAKSGRLPTYDLIAVSEGHVNPTFTYRVTADGHYAEGTGLSKQQAKHDAAQQLLSVIKEEEENNCVLERVMTTVSCPQEKVVSYNAVGALLEYCVTTNLPAPVYEVVREEGPPHAKIFTYKCAVSHVCEMRTARTKKQAKHMAANALLEKLKTLNGQEINPIALKTEMKPLPIKKDEPKVIENFHKLTRLQRVSASDSSLLINQYRAYSRLLDKSVTLMKIMSGESWTADPIKTCNAIGEELGVAASIKTIVAPKSSVSVVSLPISPALVRSADTVEEAAKLAIEALVSFIV